MTRNMKKLLTIKPNTSLKNKTGSWRTHRPITNQEKCIGCSLCAKLCPEGCIEMININNKLKPQTDYDYCKGCGLCAHECPVKVIDMKEDY
jgi:2-oxoacid:acceptor oxidoreductase delta subunit (pyruvate/2-ketoisovalerate family)